MQFINNKDMSLQDKVMAAMKEAMKEKNQEALAALRAVKSEILLAQTETGSKEALTSEQEIKILSKLIKQRKDSAAIFTEQNRNDLAEPELAQAEIISQFLPAQLSEAEVEATVSQVIAQIGAEGMKDMGKVMGIVNKQLAGQADGKTISTIVKKLLA
ncbi:MAG TPA: GatB/YqeY domain-containing protein [Flavobacteriaceae bacterium]|nr:GatB/YqeY domain-containing protein [Flavobacteriaceae bacterium]